MPVDIQEHTKRVVKTFSQWLKVDSSYTSQPVRCTLNRIIPATYFISVVRINKSEIFAQEIFSSQVRGQIVYRSWTFRKGENWFIAALEHYSHAVAYTSIRPQLEDFVRRLEIILELQSRGGAFYTETAAKAPSYLSVDLPSDSELERTGLFNRFNRSFARHSFAYTAGTMAVGILLLLGVHVLRVKSLETKVNTSLREYTVQVDHQVRDFITTTEDEIAGLINKIQENKKNFAFDRQNAYVSVMRMAEELAGYLPARKAAYKLIAGNIREAGTYSEIFYEMTRLPTEEYQARIFLATDRQSVIPLARFKPAFESMLFPVKIADEQNDGRGFRITDGYMVRRKDPVGTGGVSPHFAVDIINVSNIAYVNHAGEIIREGNPPGNVVAAYRGRVIDEGYNSRYGWYMEIEHPLIEEVTARFPEAKKWSTYYAHLKDTPALNIGDEVEGNQFISFIGDSGKSTGPHLHFEVRVYQDSGRYTAGNEHYDKINPYPEERADNE
jgi:murein DD-endopeptidase MepM/ murein hydrolase activator NlpD